MSVREFLSWWAWLSNLFNEWQVLQSWNRKPRFRRWRKLHNCIIYIISLIGSKRAWEKWPGSPPTPSYCVCVCVPDNSSYVEIRRWASPWFSPCRSWESNSHQTWQQVPLPVDSPPPPPPFPPFLLRIMSMEVSNFIIYMPHNFERRVKLLLI